MNRMIGLISVFLMLTCCSVAFAQPAPRIVSLSPSLTELTYAAGASQHLVGAAATAYNKLHPEVAKLPSVGGAFHIDVERIVALKPDLILAWADTNSPKLLAQLRSLGFKVAVFKPRHLSDIAANIRRIGKLAGTRHKADQAAQTFEKTLDKLREHYAHKKPITVFYEISPHPLYTINGEQIISQGIRLCGGRNIFAKLSSLAAPVSLATVIARNPQVIIIDGGRGNTRKRVQTWRQWQQLAAVKHHAIFTIPSGEIDQATPRMLKGIQKICRDLDTVRKAINPATNRLPG